MIEAQRPKPKDRISKTQSQNPKPKGRGPKAEAQRLKPKYLIEVFTKAWTPKHWRPKSKDQNPKPKDRINLAFEFRFFCLWTSVFGLWPLDFGLWTLDFGLCFVYCMYSLCNWSGHSSYTHPDLIISKVVWHSSTVVYLSIKGFYAKSRFIELIFIWFAWMGISWYWGF